MRLEKSLNFVVFELHFAVGDDVSFIDSRKDLLKRILAAML